jgi:hypothetical protein
MHFHARPYSRSGLGSPRKTESNNIQIGRIVLLDLREPIGPAYEGKGWTIPHGIASKRGSKWVGPVPTYFVPPSKHTF